jgi:DNA-binding CsgD family transcriptional regulator
MQPNPIDVVERAYRLDGTEREWVEELARCLYPLLDGGMGLIAYVYDLTQPATVWWPQAVNLDLSPEHHEFVARTFLSRPDDEIKSVHVTPAPLDTLGAVSRRAGFTFPITAIQQVGIFDNFALRTIQPGPRGLVFSAFQHGPRHVDRRTKAMWARVSVHLAAALRMRDTLNATEAILTPTGKLEHAEGDLKLPSARDRLRDAVKRQERARGRARREDPEGATEMWTALVAGTWSLVDHFETGGRRYIVARKNPHDCPDPRALGERERAVANLAALGKSNKLIAYELGIAESTVATHLSTAMHKLGVKSRVELLRCLLALRGGGAT